MPVGALIGAIGGVASAGISAGAASNASKVAQQTAQQNNALQSQIYTSNKAELQPYVDRGNTAGNAENDLLGLNGAPGAASTNAFNDYLGSTGYNFQLGQGTAAITGSKAASGSLDSGSTLKSLNAYGQGLAGSYFQSYLGSLSGVANTGLSGAAALAGTGQNFANAVSQNNNNAASTTANAGLASASNINGLIASGINAYGVNQGLSSFSQPTAAQISAAQASAGPVPF